MHLKARNSAYLSVFSINFLLLIEFYARINVASLVEAFSFLINEMATVEMNKNEGQR
ncbi:hypothetical protein BleG1_1792 [Shouchella lehensis G1]|uniref:Uncharacterized protein n=1 Tax=Shouchella lehensis G1 TaxID=1246626 RepID=A0A060LX73_9BACI|nr:hypothetical protein BleG1_1792 [Shouchella lehensis G1]